MAIFRHENHKGPVVQVEHKDIVVEKPVYRAVERCEQIQKPVYETVEVKTVVEKPVFEVKEVPSEVEKPVYSTVTVEQIVERPVFVVKDVAKGITLPNPDLPVPKTPSKVDHYLVIAMLALQLLDMVLQFAMRK